MTRNRVGVLILGSTIVCLLVGATLIVDIQAFASRVTPLSLAQATPGPQSDRDAPHSDRFASLQRIPGAVAWRFSEAQPDWNPGLPLPASGTVELERMTDALRVTLPKGSDPSARIVHGGIYVDLPDWRREEWTEVVVRARTTGSVNSMSVGLNRTEGAPPAGATQATFQRRGGVTPIVRDGLVHTYRIHLDWGNQRAGPWRRVGLQFQAFGSVKPGTIDILSVQVVPAAAEPAQNRVIETILETPRLKSDFALFRKALEEAHPALYRYTTKRELDARFVRAEARLARPMTILQFRNVLLPVLAPIKDGDTQFNIYQGDEIFAVTASSKQFPLALTFESERAFVVLNQGFDNRVKPGMEVLAINGQSLAEILRRILPNIVQYGDVRTYQMYQLGIEGGFFRQGRLGATGFSPAYRWYIANPSSFRTTLRDPLTKKTVVLDLTGVTFPEAEANAENNPVNRDVLAGLRSLRALHPPNAIRYLDGEDTAILVPAWGGNFPEFLKETFVALRSKGTKNLIIDLRGNTGGFDQYPALLFSYLYSKEFRHMERIQMKTFQPSFKQYTNREFDPATDSYYGPAAGIWKPDPSVGWLMTEKYPIIGVQKPSENHFDGAVYVLIDGGSISATAEFSATADFYKRATFIGEETGGAAEGDSGGDMGPTLPESHLHLRIPGEAYFSVVDQSNRRRGTLPKHAVMQTVADLAKGRDTVLEFTRELIRSGKHLQP